MKTQHTVIAAIIVLIIVAGGYFLLSSDTMRPDSPQPAVTVTPPATTPTIPGTD